MFKSIKITHLCLSICTCFAIGHSENQTLPAYTPGNPLTDASLSPGYPVDASYVTGNGWNPHITANYLYWNWDSSNFTIGDLDGANSISSSTWEKVSPGYSSGFKVGAGFNLKNLDQWDFYSEYTWYKNSGERTLTGTDSIPLSFPVGGSPLSNKDLVGSVNTEFALGFQALDVSLEKSLYAGKNLILRIGSGLKTLWVSESKTQSSNNVLVNGTDVYQNYHLNFSQTSWSLGPKLHLNLDWLIGYGMKVLFNFPQASYTLLLT